MTEIHKLDIETLEYVIDILEKKRQTVKPLVGTHAYDGDTYTTENNLLIVIQLLLENTIDNIKREREQQSAFKQLNLDTKTLDFIRFALNMEIDKKDIKEQEMEEKGDVWEIDRYKYEADGLKSFKRLIDKMIEMQE